MDTLHPNSGTWSFRDEDYLSRGTSIGARWCAYAHSLKSIDEDGTVDTNKTTGDIQGGTFIKGEERLMGSWWHGCPVIKVSGGFKPIRDRSFSPDSLYDLIDAAVKDGSEVPEGATGIVYAASKESGSQELIFMGSDFASKLLAPNRNGPYPTGSEVYDLDSSGKADPANFALLQSAWKVMTPSYAPTSGSTSSGVPGGGLFAGAAGGGLGNVPGGGVLIPGAAAGGGGEGTATVGILGDDAGGLLFDGSSGGGNVGTVDGGGGLLFDGESGGGNVGLQDGGGGLSFDSGEGSTTYPDGTVYGSSNSETNSIDVANALLNATGVN